MGLTASTIFYRERPKHLSDGSRHEIVPRTGMTGADEQSHAIEIGSGVCTTSNGTCSMPVEDISVEGVRFVHPTAPPGRRKGDCIRLLGNTAATRVQRGKIMDATFACPS